MFIQSVYARSALAALLLWCSACVPPRVPGPGPAVRGTVKHVGALQYVDIVQGTGKVARSGTRVTVHYTGWLSDGTKFDSSVDRKEPLVFELGAGRVIPGWDSGISGMRVGGKRRLIIPPALGYGSEANGPIPANSTLTFDVELLQVE